MKHIKQFLFLQAGILCIMSACQPDQSKLKEAIKKADQEIMLIHDEAMPKMSKLISLHSRLHSISDTLADGPLKDSLLRISYALSKADDSMMDWMHSYQVPAENDTALVYLEKQKKAITRVRELMFSSIEKAEKQLRP